MAAGQQAVLSLRRTRVAFEFDFDKFLVAAHYIVTQPLPELAKYKICKLLFFADKYHVVRYGRPIIGDRYCALPYGPTPSHSLDLLNEFIGTEDFSHAGTEMRRMNAVLQIDKRFQYPHFSSKKKMSAQELETLSRSDLKALDQAVARYGKMGFYQLRDVTHSDFAYVRASEELTDVRYEDFFVGDPDVIEGALEEMLENYNLRRAFPAREDL